MNPAVVAWHRRILGQRYRGTVTSVAERRAMIQWKAWDVRLRRFEPKYQKKLFAVLWRARDVLAGRINFDTTSLQMRIWVNDLVGRPVGEILEDLYYEVELKFGREHLRSLLQGGKEKAPEDPWEIWDPNEDPAMRAWNRTVTATKIKGISNATTAAIARLVDRAHREGRDTAWIARNLKGQYSFSKSRAMLIAKTEINSAANASVHYSTSRFMDTKSLWKKWLATFDARVRNSHRAANGQKVDFDKPFKVGTARLMFPCDTKGNPPAKEVVGCRCTMTYERKRGSRRR